MKKSLVSANPWACLRSLTRARIALGHAGESLPSRAQLEFQRDHALARDAVHFEPDFRALAARLESALGGGREVVRLASRARDRNEYLKRPDLGRALAPDSRELWESAVARRKADMKAATKGSRILLVVGDGLSGIGIEKHAPELARLLGEALGTSLLPAAGLVKNARVAIGDELAAIAGADLLIHLIGERPGLSSPESIGAYITYGARPGITDEARNCVSNICPDGLALQAAARKIAYLARLALASQESGIALKDNEGESLPPE